MIIFFIDADMVPTMFDMYRNDAINLGSGCGIDRRVIRH
jgi:hypothetical protein